MKDSTSRKRHAFQNVMSEGRGAQANKHAGARGGGARSALDAQLLVRIPHEEVVRLPRHALDSCEPMAELPASAARVQDRPQCPLTWTVIGGGES